MSRSIGRLWRDRLKRLIVIPIGVLRLSASAVAGTDSVFRTTYRLAGRAPVESWKSLRDARLIKQNLERRCVAS